MSEQWNWGTLKNPVSSTLFGLFAAFGAFFGWKAAAWLHRLVF